MPTAGSNTSIGGQFAVPGPSTGRLPLSGSPSWSSGSDARHSRLHSLPWETSNVSGSLLPALTVYVSSSSALSMVLVTTNLTSIVDFLLSRVTVTTS